MPIIFKNPGRRRRNAVRLNPSKRRTTMTQPAAVDKLIRSYSSDFERQGIKVCIDHPEEWLSLTNGSGQELRISLVGYNSRTRLPYREVAKQIEDFIYKQTPTPKWQLSRDKIKAAKAMRKGRRAQKSLGPSHYGDPEVDNILNHIRNLFEDAMDLGWPAEKQPEFYETLLREPHYDDLTKYVIREEIYNMRGIPLPPPLKNPMLEMDFEEKIDDLPILANPRRNGMRRRRNMTRDNSPRRALMAKYRKKYGPQWASNEKAYIEYFVERKQNSGSTRSVSELKQIARENFQNR